MGRFSQSFDPRLPNFKITRDGYVVVTRNMRIYQNAKKKMAWNNLFIIIIFAWGGMVLAGKRNLGILPGGL